MACSATHHYLRARIVCCSVLRTVLCEVCAAVPHKHRINLSCAVWASTHVSMFAVHPICACIYRSDVLNDMNSIFIQQNIIHWRSHGLTPHSRQCRNTYIIFFYISLFICIIEFINLDSFILNIHCFVVVLNSTVQLQSMGRAQRQKTITTTLMMMIIMWCSVDDVLMPLEDVKSE